MPRFRLLTAGSVLSVLLVVPPAWAGSEPQTWNREFQVAKQPTVRIRSDDGRVMVRSWKDAKVTVRVTMRGTEGLLIGKPRPRVEISQEGNEVRVLARIEGSTSGIVFSPARLEVEVWLPRQSNLNVVSGDGPVSVDDVSGHIELETADGSLTARGLKGDVQVRSSDGRVELDELDGSLRLETQDGHSEVRGRFDAMDVESQDGGIEIDALPGSKVREGWSVRSQDGGIRLRIPRALAATLDASTEDGGLSVDLPVLVQGTVRRHQLMGDLNGGGEILRMRCNDGSIRISAID